jgi:hypothetical protein
MIYKPSLQSFHYQGKTLANSDIRACSTLRKGELERDLCIVYSMTIPKHKTFHMFSGMTIHVFDIHSYLLLSFAKSEITCR